MPSSEYFDGQKPDNKKEEIQRSRITAVVLASATVISLVFMVFAFIQKGHAEAKQREVERLQQKLQQTQQQAEEFKAEAMRQAALVSVLGGQLAECKLGNR